jgi:hypothetical protein
VILALTDSHAALVTEGASVCMSPHVKGRISEMAFALEATRRGWDVCAPSAGMDDYDFIIKRPQMRPVVVQVKWSTLIIKGNSRGYNIRAANPKRIYSGSAFDVLASHLPDVNMWVFFRRAELGERTKTTYTLPMDRRLRIKSHALAPRNPNNWHLLDEVAESLTAHQKSFAA